MKISHPILCIALPLCCQRICPFWGKKITITLQAELKHHFENPFFIMLYKMKKQDIIFQKVALILIQFIMTSIVIFKYRINIF